MQFGTMISEKTYLNTSDFVAGLASEKEFIFTQKIAPPRELTLFIDTFFFLEKQAPSPSQQLIFPTGAAKVLFHFGDIPRRRSPRTRKFLPLPKQYIFGANDSAHKVQTPKNLKVLVIKFHPWGFVPLVQENVEKFAGQRCSILHLFSRKQIEEIYRLNSPEQKTEKLSTFLRKKIPNINLKKLFLVRQITLKILKYKGNLSVKNAAENIPVSRRQLERIFKEYTGMTVGKFIKIVRFHNVLEVYKSRAFSSLTELSYECGYADQSHFVRDFKYFTGKTPRECLHKVSENYFCLKLV